MRMIGSHLRKGEQDGDRTRKGSCGSMEVGEEGMTPEGSPQKLARATRIEKRHRNQEGLRRWHVGQVTDKRKNVI